MMEIDQVGNRRSWQVGESTNPSYGALASFPDALLIGSSAIHPEDHMSLAVFQPAGEPRVGELWELSPLPVGAADSVRFARTPTGLAAVWSQVGHTLDRRGTIAILDCCPRQ